MNRERHHRVMALFRRAVEMESSQRDAYLDEACGDDDALRAEVREMLEYDSVDGDDFAATGTSVGRQIIDAAVHDQQGTTPAHGLPAKIGGYRPVRTIGEGGMGIVYEAEQESPRRTVALKMIRSGAMSPSHLRRFRLEAELLGRLQHPGIARIYEAGTLDSGGSNLPFFAMELIEGQSITAYAEQAKQVTRDRLQLFVLVCDAVHHAHQKGVVHRDLKPDNILVDLAGVPRVLDFGVARATDADLQVSTMQTDVGSLIGTVPYMSPEQVTGRVEEIDIRSDVYALGVVLFELLAGRLPHDLVGRSVVEAARIISEDDPTRLGSVASRFRNDLDVIVGKALEKETERRYQSAAELGADVRRFLNSEPVSARPPSTIYLARRFVRRNRAIVIGTLMTITALSVGLGLAVKYALDARQSAATTEQLRPQAEAHLLAVEARWKSYCSTMTQAAQNFEQDALLSKELLEQSEVAFRGWEHAYLTNRIRPIEDYRRTLDTPASNPHWSSDGRPRVLQSIEGTARVVDVMEGRIIHEQPGIKRSRVFKRWIDLSGDGSRLAYFDPTVQAVQIQETEGQRHWTIDLSNLVTTLNDMALNQSGTRLSLNGPARDEDASLAIVVHVEDGTDLLRKSYTPKRRLTNTLTPDGAHLVVGWQEQRERFELELLNVDTGSLLDRTAIDVVGILNLKCHNDKTVVGVSSAAKSLHVWRAGAADPVLKIASHPQSAKVAFSPDGLFAFTRSRGFEIWDLGSRRQVGRYASLPGYSQMAFDPTGKRLLITNRKIVRIVSVDSLELTEFADSDSLYLVAYSPDGSLLATAGGSGKVQLWDVLSGERVGEMQTEAEVINALSFSEDGQRLFTVTRPSSGHGIGSQALEMWDVTSQSRTRRIKDGTLVDHVHPAGAAIVGKSGIGFARSVDGSRSVRWERTGAVVVKDTVRNTDVATIEAGFGLSISRDNRLIASGGKAPGIWDAETSGQIHHLPTPSDEMIYSTAFSADGERLVGGGRSGLVYVWVVETGDLVCTFEEHAGAVHHVAFSPDGTQLATASGDGTAHLFDVVSYADRRRHRNEAEAVRAALLEEIETWRKQGMTEAAITQRIRKDSDQTTADKCVVLNPVMK